MSKKEKRVLIEGIVKKGGVNKKPSTNKPKYKPPPQAKKK